MNLMILSLILFGLAAICDAVRDKITHHYNKSILSNAAIFDEKWWNPRISWRNKYVDGDLKRGFRYKGLLSPLNNFTDAWHTFKVAEIFLLAGSAIVQISNPQGNLGYGWWIWPVYLLSYGLFWNLPFNLFYNKILSKEE